MGMGVGQCLRDLPPDLHRVGYRNLPFPRQAISERFAIDERHHVVQQFPDAAGIV